MRRDGAGGTAAPPTPDLSLSIPCYNEEDCLGETIPPLARAFADEGVAVELVLVDNGSSDSTSEVIDRLVEQGLPVTKGTVEANQGQGLGFLVGFRLARGRYVGNLCADGQVEPEDVVRVFRACRDAGRPTLAKARRRYRDDSWVRKIVSVGYNILMHGLFPGVPTIDVNGNPKILPADVLRKMEIESTDWFVEAEIMLKARHLHLPVIEMDVFGKPREGGTSHVRFTTALEFALNMVRYRFGGPWREWQRRVAAARDSSPAETGSRASGSRA